MSQGYRVGVMKVGAAVPVVSAGVCRVQGVRIKVWKVYALGFATPGGVLCQVPSLAVLLS